MRLRDIMRLQHTILALTCGILITCASVPACSAAGSEQPQAKTVASEAPTSGDAIALERLKFEFQKVLEREKLEVERMKGWLTALSIFVPVCLGLITLAIQLSSARKLREREAKDDFDLKAAEIVLTSETPRAAENKARALALLFPGKLPPNFAEGFRPENFGGPPYVPKIEMFKAASAKAQTSQEVFTMWHLLFPNDDWIKPLFSIVSKE